MTNGTNYLGFAEFSASGESIPVSGEGPFTVKGDRYRRLNEPLPEHTAFVPGYGLLRDLNGGKQSGWLKDTRRPSPTSTGYRIPKKKRVSDSDDEADILESPFDPPEAGYDPPTVVESTSPVPETTVIAPEVEAPVHEVVGVVPETAEVIGDAPETAEVGPECSADSAND